MADSILSSRYRADLARERNALGKKISEARRARRLTQAELARLLGDYGVRVQAPAVNKWESGETVPGAYQLLALCHALDIRQGLAFFTGALCAPADPLNAEGRRLLKHYRAYLESQDRYLSPAREPAVIRVRLSALPASAGTGDFLSEGGFEWVEFPASIVPPGTDFAVRVHGDSMEPAYRDGQIVFFGQCDRLNPGEIGLFTYEGQGYIKLYRETFPEGEEIEDIRGRQLFIYTDGLNEAENNEKDQFGDDHLLDIMATHHFADAKETIEYLKAEVEKHREGAEPNDDLTMLCFTVKG